MKKFILAVALAGGMLAAEKVGNGVSAPKVIYKAEPAYTEEAKAARVQGTVALKLVVTEEGTAEDMAVVLLTQLMPSSTYPIRRELRVLTYQAIVD